MKKDADKVLWDSFTKTGKIGYYLMYKELTKD